MACQSQRVLLRCGPTRSTRESRVGDSICALLVDRGRFRRHSRRTESPRARARISVAAARLVSASLSAGVVALRSQDAAHGCRSDRARRDLRVTRRPGVCLDAGGSGSAAAACGRRAAGPAVGGLAARRRSRGRVFRRLQRALRQVLRDVRRYRRDGARGLTRRPQLRRAVRADARSQQLLLLRSGAQPRGRRGRASGVAPVQRLRDGGAGASSGFALLADMRHAGSAIGDWRSALRLEVQLTPNDRSSRA